MFVCVSRYVMFLLDYLSQYLSKVKPLLDQNEVSAFFSLIVFVLSSLTLTVPASLFSSFLHSVFDLDCASFFVFILSSLFDLDCACLFVFFTDLDCACLFVFILSLLCLH